MEITLEPNFATVLTFFTDVFLPQWTEALAIIYGVRLLIIGIQEALG